MIRIVSVSISDLDGDNVILIDTDRYNLQRKFSIIQISIIF